jgi:twinkle protein
MMENFEENKNNITNAEKEESTLVQAHLPCPDCGSHDALSMYSDGHTYCFSCQTNTPQKTKEKRNTTVVTPEKKAQSKGNNLMDLSDFRMDTLSVRHLNKATCIKYGYYQGKDTKGRPCQVACYYDDQRNCIGQKVRYPNKNFRVYGNISHRFFGQHLFANGRKVVITEGEIDCLTVSQVTGNKYPVVSIPNGCNSALKVFKENLEWLNGFDEVIVMFDMDDPGRKATMTVVDLLPAGKLKIASLPLKDPNDCLKANRPDEIITAIFQAKPYRPDGIIDGTDLWEQLKDEPEEVKGYDLPWNIDLQKMTLGLRKGELIVVTAGTGIGKTTFVRQIAHHLGVNENLKVGMMMLEESTLRTAKGLMAVHAKKRLTLNRHLISDDEYKKIYDETFSAGNFVFYQHFGSMESDNLLNRMRYLAVAERCDFVIFDHISIAISGLDIENERKATDILMTKLRSLAEETGMGMIIVSHLRRVQEGNAAEEGGAISLSHLRGSHALAQLSDGVWALERNQQAEDPLEKNLVRIRILKNRHTGETGIGGYLRYNKDTDCLEEATAGGTALDGQQQKSNKQTKKKQGQQEGEKENPFPPPEQVDF